MNLVANKVSTPFFPESLIQLTDQEINEAISSVGFHNKKVVCLRRCAEIIIQDFGGEIPRTLEGLLALPGFGPNMSHLALRSAWGLNEGVVVDVHVDRICNRLGWVETKKPERTRTELESWLPVSPESFFFFFKFDLTLTLSIEAHIFNSPILSN